MFERDHLLPSSNLKMEAAGSSKTLVPSTKLGTVMCLVTRHGVWIDNRITTVTSRNYR
jgi:hypothetical protein